MKDRNAEHTGFVVMLSIGGEGGALIVGDRVYPTRQAAKRRMFKCVREDRAVAEAAARVERRQGTSDLKAVTYEKKGCYSAEIHIIGGDYRYLIVEVNTGDCVARALAKEAKKEEKRW